MYVIVIATFLVIVILFWETIMTLVKTMSDTSSLKNGYLWFILLLVINVILISIILGYYYHITHKTGEDGLTGAAGLTGLIGEQCYFTNPNGGCAK